MTKKITKPDPVHEAIKALAKYLVADQGRKSIELELQKPWALEWSRTRSMFPIFGYATEDEAVEILERFFRPKGKS